MIFATTFVLFGAAITVLVCRTINKNFEAKNNKLAEKEKKLIEKQMDLRKKRKAENKRLTDLKTFLKAGIKLTQAPAEPSGPPENIKDWLLQTSVLTETQFLTAEIYATEKNMDIISALLTLNMINVNIYEQAKKLKLC